MIRAVEVVADTLSQKPEVGVFGSMVGVALSPIAIISLVSAALGLCITVITLIIKIMDIMEKLKRKKKELDSDEIKVIDGVTYERKIEREEEE